MKYKYLHLTYIYIYIYLHRSINDIIIQKNIVYAMCQKTKAIECTDQMQPQF